MVPLTGIVIVTWNSSEVIGACLDSCLRLGNVETVVVDNASSDNTVLEVQRRPAIHLIANGENRGFAAAVNQGVASLDTAEVLLLNPDAQLIAGVEELAEAVSRPGVAAAAGRLVSSDGVTQSGFNIRSFPTAMTLALEVLGLNRLLPQNRWNRLYRADVNEHDETEVDQPAGAFLMLNKMAWSAIGGFDETFAPVWFEDVDFCRRLHNAGFKILFLPASVAVHIGGHSADRLSWEERQLFWYSSLLRYSSKHFNKRGRRIVSAALMLSCIPRAMLALAAGKGYTAVAVYSKVFLIAWRCGCLGRCGPGQLSQEEIRAKQFHS